MRGPNAGWNLPKANPPNPTDKPPDHRYHMAMTSNMREPPNIHHAKTRRANRPPQRGHGFVRGSVLRHIARKD